MSEQAVFDTLKYRTEVDTSGNRYYRNAASQPHRIGGPAIELTDGSKFWYQNGRLHREDGPAIELPSGAKSWYINDKLLSEARFNQLVSENV